MLFVVLIFLSFFFPRKRQHLSQCTWYYTINSALRAPYTPPAMFFYTTYPIETCRLSEHARRGHRRAAAAVPADRGRTTAPVPAVLVVPAAAAAALEAGVSDAAVPVADGEAAPRRTPGAFSEVLEEVPVGDEHAGRVPGVVGGGVPDVSGGRGWMCAGWGCFGVCCLGDWGGEESWRRARGEKEVQYLVYAYIS